MSPTSVLENDPSNRQEMRSKRSTARLLDAAGELISEIGYTRTTLAMVGERAGYSRGLATQRFGSKQRLLQALVERITQQWREVKVEPRAADASGLHRVLIDIDAISRQAEDDARTMRILYALTFEALGPNVELRRHFTDLHRQLRRYMADAVSDGIADGSIRPDLDPAEEGSFVVTALRGIAFQWCLDPDDFSLTGALAHLYRLVQDRLQSKPEEGKR